MPFPFRRLIYCTSVITLVLAAGCGGPTPQAPAESNAAPGAAPVAPNPPDASPEVSPPAAPDAPDPVLDWMVIPGLRIGAITAASTAAELAALYGAENVRDEPYPLGEGHSEPGTVIFPDDEAKRALILWADLELKKNPLAVRIDGEGALWKTAEGVAVGVTLKKIEELNGKPFRLYGFDWDYGGQLVDSNGGALLDLPHDDPEGGFRGGALMLTFQPDPTAPPLPAGEYRQVAGDSVFGSDHPVMQQLNPIVDVMIVNFPDAG